MKHQYFGDVTDYVKYGLLREFARAGLSSALVWMLTPGDGRSDGSRIRYLSDRERWRRHDPELFDALRQMVVEREARDVCAIERSGLLPGCRSFSDPVPGDAAARGAWFRRALDATRGADLVLFDPDNGLEVKSVRYGRAGSTKYLFRDEVVAAWRQGHSVIVIQFYPRVERREFIARKLRELADLTGTRGVTAFAAAQVVYLLAARDGHAGRLAAATRAVASGWTGAIEVTRLPRGA